MKNKKSFVEQLEQADIEKILQLIGLELDDERYDRDGNKQGSIIRGESEGEYHIIAFCNDRKQQEAESEIAKYMYEKSPAFRNFINNINAINMSLAGFGGMNNPYMANGKVILNFEDFTLTESLSLKSEEDEIEYDRMMTEVYQIYMAEKFGKEYNKKKDEYIKSFQEAQKEDEGQQMQ